MNHISPIFLVALTDIFLGKSRIPLWHIIRVRFQQQFPRDWEERLKAHIDQGAEISAENRHYMHYPHHAGKNYRGLQAMDVSMLNALIRNLKLLDPIKDAALFAALNDLMIARNKIHEPTMSKAEKFELACAALKGMETYLTLNADERRALMDFYMGIDESLEGLVADDAARLSQANAMIAQGLGEEGVALLQELVDRSYVPAMLRLAQLYRTTYSPSLTQSLQASLELLDKAAGLGENVDALCKENSRVLELLFRAGTSAEVDEELLALHRQGEFLPKDCRCFDECFRRLSQRTGITLSKYVTWEVTMEHNLYVLPLFVTYGCAGEIGAALSVLPADAATNGWRILCEDGYIPGIVQYSARQGGGIGCKADSIASTQRLTSLFDAFVKGRVCVEEYKHEFEETCEILSLIYTNAFEMGECAGEFGALMGIVVNIMAEKMIASQRVADRLEKFYNTFCVDFKEPNERGSYPRLHTTVHDALLLLAQDSPRKEYWETKRKEYLARFWEFCLEKAIPAAENADACKAFFEFHEKMCAVGMMDLPSDAGREDVASSAKERFRKALVAAKEAKKDFADPEGAAKRKKAARNAAIGGIFGSMAAGVAAYFLSKYVIKWILVIFLGFLSLPLELFGSDLLSDLEAVKRFSEWVCIIIFCGLALLWFAASVLHFIPGRKRKKK